MAMGIFFACGPLPCKPQVPVAPSVDLGRYEFQSVRPQFSFCLVFNRRYFSRNEPVNTAGLMSPICWFHRFLVVRRCRYSTSHGGLGYSTWPSGNAHDQFESPIPPPLLGSDTFGVRHFWGQTLLGSDTFGVRHFWERKSLGWHFVPQTSPELLLVENASRKNALSPGWIYRIFALVVAGVGFSKRTGFSIWMMRSRDL